MESGLFCSPGQTLAENNVFFSNTEHGKYLRSGIYIVARIYKPSTFHKELSQVKTIGLHKAIAKILVKMEHEMRSK